jgi:hypothetical protein
MTKTALTPELRPALAACKAADQLLTGEITFWCINNHYMIQGVTYHQLAQLARLGHLIPSAEGRYGVYYRLASSHCLLG